MNAIDEQPGGSRTIVGTRDDRGLTSLAAYVVPTDATLSGSALRAFMADRLSGIMVPSRFVVLERLPLTADLARAIERLQPDRFGRTS